MASLERSFARITSQIAAMRSLIAGSNEQLHCAADGVSGWCPAEHLDHMAKASSSVLRRLAATDASAPDRGINLVGRVVLAIGRIPRGRGKSPEKLHGTRADAAALMASLDELEGLARSLSPKTLAAVRTPMVLHPKFGGLTPSQALRFVAIHNDHHLRIIADIARAAKA